ncbi:LOW QUALITY PROTEIN: hypothetical protein RJ639_021240 [Escallonia herrerae]|uniref:Serine-threonine/tyrosine-protein kinase catalytic domain-containing protein n=1 Tax=Escallonia herrerae TaxID=1293975 RepID=A0AA89AHA5_9ASTE|nr:LOW QUALITY PROTEIN: hypothetical protein RJ639_021240 [Escallonia herrerae]
MCGFKNDTSRVTVATQCVDIPKTTKGASQKLILVVLLALGAIFLALELLFIMLMRPTESRAKTRKGLTNFLRITRLSSPQDTRLLISRRSQINSRTSSARAVMGLFKGKLSSEVFVAVKVLNDSTGNGEEFTNEVGTMARIHHVNVVRLVGFCADGTRRALVYEFLPNDSLEKGTMGYIAPEVFSRNFGNVSHKSDVYSFGMMLLEMVGGRKNTDATVQNTSQAYFPELVYNRLCEGEEIGIKVEEEEHGLIAKRLTVVGLWCVQWYPMGRPSMKTVVQMLEGKRDALSMPPNPFDSTKPARALDNELPIISEA